MMAIAYGDEGQRLGTRPTRMRTGQEYAHTNRNEEPELPRDEVPKLSRDLNWCGVGRAETARYAPDTRNGAKAQGRSACLGWSRHSNPEYEEFKDTDGSYQHRESYGIVIEPMPSFQMHDIPPVAVEVGILWLTNR
jgi:hypothetical protein